MSNEIANCEPNESKEAYWRRVLQEWQASGLKGKEFQRRRNLSEHAFIYWKLKLIGCTERKPTLVPVKMRTAGQQGASTDGIRIRVGELFTIELAQGCDVTRLREVLAAVRECAK